MKKFLFKADAALAFRKLAASQLGNPARWIWEIFANALDAQGENTDPIEVTLEKGEKDKAARLSVTDSGPGLTAESLFALFLIGLSTKRLTRMKTVGRFGFGFLSCFNPRAGVRRVLIETRYEGTPVRIIYTCRGKELPLWHYAVVLPGEVPERGCRFIFELAPERVPDVAQEIRAFCERTVVPVRVNGQTYVHNASDLLRGIPGGLLVRHSEAQVEVFLAASDGRDRPARDHVEINIRRMPVFQGGAFRTFICKGDKMIQNSYNDVFLPQEDLLIVSQIGEPTVGRDDLVRDNDFARLAQAVKVARAQALAQLLARERQARSLTSLALANLYTLRSDVAATLESRLEESRGYLREALERLVRVPVFPTFDGRMCCLKALYDEAPAHGVYLTAEGEDTATQIDHACPFVLDADRPVPHELTGWHQMDQVRNVLAGVFGYFKHKKLELVPIEEIIWSAQKAEEMEKRGVIRQHEVRLEVSDTAPDSATTEWLGMLTGLLNRPSFRKALTSRYHAIRRIRLLSLNMTVAAANQQQGLPLALFLRPSARCAPGELRLGLRVADENVRALVRQGRQGCLQLVPLIAESISAYAFGTFVLQTDSPLKLAHTTPMLVDRIGCADRLVDAALAEAERFLAGEDAHETADAQEWVTL